MQEKILELSYRKKIIKEIKGQENKGRKTESLQQVEIYNDRIRQHVIDRMKRNFSEKSLLEMPVVASINLARRIAKQESGIYRNEPKRTFTNLTDKQREVVELIYRDMGIDSKLLKSNESFKLQNQNHVMVVPKNGKLIMRVLRNHHLDVIPDHDDPETGSVYVFHSFDKETLITKSEGSATGNTGRFDIKIDQDSNRHNEKIGDAEDYESGSWIWWSKDFNFTTDGNGNITSGTKPEEFENASHELNIVDISIEKDFEYWVRQGESLTEFTIEYNSYWSSVQQVVMMQGFAQAYLKGPEDLLPTAVQIGPNYVLKLAVDPNNPVDVEFGYASPSPDLSGTIAAGEAMLANFLTSRGLDANLVSGSGSTKKFSSGTERLLSMIEVFEASKSDYDIYKRAEDSIYKLVKAWHNQLRQADVLDPKYITAELPEDSEVEIEYSGPEMIQSEKEKLENIDAKVELGLMSVVEALMEIRNVDRKEAEKILKQIKEDQELENEEPEEVIVETPEVDPLKENLEEDLENANIKETVDSDSGSEGTDGESES